jgi:hypothetical protein
MIGLSLSCFRICGVRARNEGSFWNYMVPREDNPLLEERPNMITGKHDNPIPVWTLESQFSKW